MILAAFKLSTPLYVLSVVYHARQHGRRVSVRQRGAGVVIKNVSLLFLAVFVLMTFPSMAQETGAWNKYPEWFQCRTSGQCVLTCENCGPVAINKEYVSHSWEVVPACLQSIPCHRDEVAQCVTRQCRVIYPDKRLECQSDDQCVPVRFKCADMAVNKIYQNQFGAPSPSCLSDPLHNPDAVAKCINQKCVVTIPEKHQ